MKGLFLFPFALLYTALLFSQSPEIKWWYDLNDSAFGSAAAADIDEDGMLELVFGCYRNDSMVYALNAEDGSLLWKRNLAGDFEGCNDVAPLIYDVDQDGALEAIVPASCNPRTFCLNGKSGETKWVTFLHGSDSPPTVSDIDKDSRPEILHGNFGGSVSCLNGEDGSIAWDLMVDPNSWIQTAPIILDVDNNGELDFVVGNSSFGTDHRIFCYQANNQQLLWDTDLPEAEMYHGASFADLDEDGFMELVIGSYDGNIYAINAEDGSLHWSYALPNSFYTIMPTSIADLNQDGKYEIAFFDFDRVGVLDHAGKLLWDFTIPSLGQSFRGAAISDINGDKRLDLVFGSDNGNLYALNGYNGTLIWNIDLAAHYGSSDFQLDHGPVIADFDMDGLLDVFIVGGHTVYPDFENNYGRAYAISTNSAGGPDWPMFRRDSVRSAHIPIEAPTAVSAIAAEQVDLQLFPNPAAGLVQIRYQLEKAIDIKISLLDAYGRELAILKNGWQSAGEHQLIWNMEKRYSAGLYLYKLEWSDGVLIEKVINGPK